MATLMERMRPKGYDKKAWEHFYKEAEADKLWAEDIVKHHPEWSQEASISSLKMLGSYLYLEAHKLAKEAYDYVQMRAYGQTYIGALDPTSRETWESITGKKVNIKKTWKYDHTNSNTHSIYKNKKWYNSSGKEILSGK